MKTTIDNGFKIWLNYVVAYRKKDTAMYYKKQVKYLKEFFTENQIEYFQDIETFTFDQLIIFLRNKNLSNNTINKYVTVLKVCINYLNDKNITKVYIPKKIKLIETTPKIDIIETEVLNKIFNYLESCNNKNMKLCFLLMLSTGIRRTEITKIKVKNIILEENQIFLDDTKNNKPRMIYVFDDEIKKLISKQMNQIPNQEFLLYSSKSNGYATPNTVSGYFQKIKKDLKLKTLSPHKLRHTYATVLIKEGADLNSVRLLLGHSTLHMTLRYIQMNNEDLKNINKKCNIIKKTKNKK